VSVVPSYKKLIGYLKTNDVRRELTDRVHLLLENIGITILE